MGWGVKRDRKRKTKGCYLVVAGKGEWVIGNIFLIECRGLEEEEGDLCC